MESFSIIKYNDGYYFHHHLSNSKSSDIIGDVFACLTIEYKEIFVNDKFKEYLEGSLKEILNKYGHLDAYSGSSLIDSKNKHKISLIINYNKLRDRTKKLNKFK